MNRRRGRVRSHHGFDCPKEAELLHSFSELLFIFPSFAGRRRWEVLCFLFSFAGGDPSPQIPLWRAKIPRRSRAVAGPPDKVSFETAQHFFFSVLFFLSAADSCAT